jgi:hypothetical protein
MTPVRFIGPVQHDPDKDDLAGMGWFIPYLDSSRFDSELLWHVFPQWTKNRRPTRDHAIEARERLLRLKGSVPVGDMDLFVAICEVVGRAKGWRRRNRKKA